MNPTFPRLLLTFGLVGSAAIAAQTAPAPANTPASQAPILHVSSRLVALDVVVTDSRGLPIKGLQQTDFALIEGKKPQTIASFEEHASVTNAPPAAAPKLPPGVFTNFTPAPAGSAVNVILLDALNTPIVDQGYVRDQMLKSVRQYQWSR